ncbi:hypothetical protein GTX07_17570, partial [Streptomyces sp. SID5606]|nr:hypothetical protein [Streptomyces sp. SID5606]
MTQPGVTGCRPRPPSPTLGFARAGGPPSPQRHDCPQLGRRRAAYGEKGVCRGVSARSGWRVNAPHILRHRFRAVPRTDTP